MASQINDPRIEVQTYNGPNAPVIPKNLQSAKVDVDIEIPNKTIPATPPLKHITTLVSEENKYNDLIIKDLENEFLTTMKEHDPLFNRKYYDGVGVNMGVDKPEPAVNLALNTEYRTISQRNQDTLIDKMQRKLFKITGQYSSFKKGVNKKLETLGGLMEERRKKDMHLMFAKINDMLIL